VREPYRPETYWESRFSDKLDVSIVGHAGLGYIYNAWLYRGRFRALRRALHAQELDVRQNSVIEIGVGSGAYLPFWQSLGVSSLTGLDITSASVALLSNRYPQFRFAQGDIGRAAPPIEGAYDIVTAFDVLFHITDTADFANAIGNIATLTRPGGVAILSDGFCSNPWGPFYHEYHRTYRDYCQELERVGLEPFHLEPIFFTMSTTLCEPESKHRYLAAFVHSVLQLVIRLAARRHTEWANNLVGSGLFVMDGILGRTMATGPSLKYLFARRQA
jgi:SAM-dependent methyltransferase